MAAIQGWPLSEVPLYTQITVHDEVHTQITVHDEVYTQITVHDEANYKQ